MTSRYVLRFETGERQGETVPLTVAAGVGAAFTIGRKPGNSLQVVETSVSGRHAEFVLSDDGVQLRDLDSTNGTRAGGERVRTATLRHGDEFALGNVLFTLIEVGAPEPVAAPALPSLKPTTGTGALPKPAGDNLARTQIQPRDEALEITAADLARSKGGSKVGLVAIGALAVVGGGVWFWLRGQGTEPGRAPARPVTAPSGNLLGAGYSFEDDHGWTSDETAPDVFSVSRGARASGERGLVAVFGEATDEDVPSPAAGADGAGAEFALHRSDSVRVRRATELEAQVSVRTEGDANARIGLLFEGSGEPAPTPCAVWSDPIQSASGHELFAFKCVTPPGFDRVSVLLAAEASSAPARAAGPGAAEVTSEVALDDASLVVVGNTEPPRIGAWEIVGLGAPAHALVLTKIERVLVSGARVVRAVPGASPHAATVLGLELSANAVAHGVDAASTLEFVAEAPLVAGGLASLGQGGYIAHSANFERSGVTDLLLGKDNDLVRVAFSRGVDVRGAASGDGCRVRVDLGPGDTVRWQLGFEDERIQSQRIAREARAARSEKRPGDALAAWAELLAKTPFEQSLVDEAATARGEIVRAGLGELRELGRELERARFFRLVDLYDELADRTRKLGQRYAGSEVDQGASELAATLGAERAVLARDLDRYERQRLEAIATFLDAHEAPNLAREVRGYLTEQLGAGQPQLGAGQLGGGH